MEGWRFATKAEVGRFFADFTGVPDGRTEDPGVERALQRLLGGPTDTPKNEQTGWSRRSTYVRIAGLTPAPAEDAPRAAGVPVEMAYPCPPCKTGFNYFASSILEDTLNGKFTMLTVEPGIDFSKRGWTDGDHIAPWESGFFLVRKKK